MPCLQALHAGACIAGVFPEADVTLASLACLYVASAEVFHHTVIAQPA